MVPDCIRGLVAHAWLWPSCKISAPSLHEAHLPSDPAVGRDLTRSFGFREPFCSQKQLIPPGMIRPSPAQKLHTTHGSVPADLAVPCKEAAVGLDAPGADLCFVLYIIVLYCLVSASAGACMSSPRLGFLGFYVLQHHVEKYNHHKGKETGRKCLGSSMDLSGCKGRAYLENS